jgi:hypothetical protein
MLNKGQVGDAVKYFIIALVMVAITLFGYNIFSSIRDKTCTAEISDFEFTLKNLDKKVKFGSIKDFTSQLPCGADQLYFIDLDKEINLELLDENPFLRDSIKSKALKNVFLLKDGQVLVSFYAGNLDLGYPHYTCLIPRLERVNFFIEGKGTSSSVFPACGQPVCTIMSVSPKGEDAVTVLKEAVDFNCLNCPDSVAPEFVDFIKTRENSQIFRRFESCKEEGKTVVEIIIRPNDGASLKNFRLYEFIPKNCIDDLNLYLSKIGGNYEIKSDPLIVWSFDEIRQEERVLYELNTTFKGSCEETIKGLGIAKVIQGGVNPPLEIGSINKFLESIENDEIPKNSPPVIDIPDLIISGKKRTISLKKYSSDIETKTKDLSFMIKGQTRPFFIDCRIKEKHQVECEIKTNPPTFSDVTVEVNDGQLKSEDTFRITSA